MRADARSLLNRLGRSDFAYKQFADRFSDLELWPIFEALLKDPRIFQQEMTLTSHRPAAEASALNGLSADNLGPVCQHELPLIPSDPDPLSEFFIQYEADVGTHLDNRQDENLSVILRRMSNLNERKEL